MNTYLPPEKKIINTVSVLHAFYVLCDTKKKEPIYYLLSY